MDPATATSALGGAAIFEAVTGVADIVGGVGTLVEWARAQDGLKFNNHTFNIPGKKEEDEEKPASTASPTSPKSSKDQESASIAVSKAKIINPAGIIAPLLTVKLKGLTTKVKSGATEKDVPLGVFDGLLQFAVALRRPFKDEPFENGQVVLVNAAGFDSGIGSQAEFEFSGTEWGDVGYLLTFQGQVNPVGSGFERIAGAVLVNKRGVVTPQGSWKGAQPSSLGFFSPVIQNVIPWDKGKGFRLELL